MVIRVCFSPPGPIVGQCVTVTPWVSGALQYTPFHVALTWNGVYDMPCDRLHYISLLWSDHMPW